MIGGPYKSHIYGMGPYYSDALSPPSMTRDASIRLEVRYIICSHVHALNEELQKRLEEQD